MLAHSATLHFKSTLELMTNLLTDSLTFLGKAYAEGPLEFNRGIEREALRVDAAGNLAQTPHPEFLGSKLTHPTITTDFSESQVELITPVAKTADAALSLLNDVHRYVYSGLGEESLWSASMPCALGDDQSIPLAQYGPSNLGRLKTTYRHGLSNRYGRAMQTICAIHYNFSVDASLWQHLAHLEKQTNDKHYRSRRYFDLMRNFRRLSWLPVYLFGASPAVCKSFVKGRKHALHDFDADSLFLEKATSLRNGDLGYQSETQAGMLDVCYNSLDNYIGTLAKAICTPHEIYQKLGVKHGQEYLQVSGNILQSEAEFYTTIRAKCVPPKGANFLTTLKAEGVEYIEVRLLDVNPYLPLGIDETQIHFLDAFLLYCLLTASPEHDPALCASVSSNLRAVVHNGQDTSTSIENLGQQQSIKTWGQAVLLDVMHVARWLDKTNGVDVYAASVSAQQAKLMDSGKIPSARIIADMRAESSSFFRFAMNQSQAHKAEFERQGLSQTELTYFQALSEKSLREQAQIEATPGPSFDDYLAAMLKTYKSL